MTFRTAVYMKQEGGMIKGRTEKRTKGSIKFRAGVYKKGRKDDNSQNRWKEQGVR